jgi:uncharacterized membrane protein/uncharacterized membrane protein YeaQ/YmgE (transglycosylase-associated protein family)
MAFSSIRLDAAPISSPAAHVARSRLAVPSDADGAGRREGGKVLNFLIWIVSGLAAGWLVRIAMKSGRDYGIVGDLTLGSLGALIGEWILRGIHVTTPDEVIAHIVVAMLGASVLVAGLRLARHAFQATGLPQVVPTGLLTADLEQQVKRLGDVERRVLATVLRRRPIVDPAKAFDAQLTFGQRLADRVAAFGGSWTFIGIFAVVILAWIMMNDTIARPFDPYPYILLNLMLSCLAAIQAPVIMMSQNRQAAHDRLEARSDYEVNLRAEVEIMSLHAKLDDVRGSEWQQFLDLQREQLACLKRLEARLGLES